MISFSELNTPIGKIGISEEGGYITNIYLLETSFPKENKFIETTVIKEAKKQLEEYFAGKRKTFDIPLKPKGSEFMQKVWSELCKIPYGELVSYKYIADKIGCPKGFRAVGNANNKNPIAIIIPCHRVIGTNGKLVGYAGGLDMKTKLINLEKGC